MRILKPGGLFAASLNSNEPFSACEPQTLTEENVKNLLLKNIAIQSYRLALKTPNDTYRKFYENNLLAHCPENEEYISWVVGTKNSNR